MRRRSASSWPRASVVGAVPELAIVTGRPESSPTRSSPASPSGARARSSRSTRRPTRDGRLRGPRRRCSGLRAPGWRSPCSAGARRSPRRSAVSGRGPLADRLSLRAALAAAPAVAVVAYAWTLLEAPVSARAFARGGSAGAHARPVRRLALARRRHGRRLRGGSRGRLRDLAAPRASATRGKGSATLPRCRRPSTRPTSRRCTGSSSWSRSASRSSPPSARRPGGRGS